MKQLSSLAVRVAVSIPQLPLVLLHVAVLCVLTGIELPIADRWERPDMPDTEGVQMDKIVEYVVDNASIELVWYDFW